MNLGPARPPATCWNLARQLQVLSVALYTVLAPQLGLGGGMASHSSRLPALKRYLQRGEAASVTSGHVASWACHREASATASKLQAAAAHPV